MSNLRLFAGLISFRSNLCLSHFWARGPAGILALSVILLQRLLSEPQQNCDGNGGITEKNQTCHDGSSFVEHRSIVAVLPPDRLEHAGEPVTQVQAKQTHAQEV